jgi:hypothetical protein
MKPLVVFDVDQTIACGRLPALTIDNWESERVEGVAFLKVADWNGSSGKPAWPYEETA